MLSNKYRAHRRSFRSATTLTSCSSTWVGLGKGEEVFSKGSKWIAGKDSSLSIWLDKWLNKGPLRSLISGPLNKGEENLKVMDIASFLGWRWARLSFDLPASILLEIKATHVPFSNHSEDRLSWFSSLSGEFKLKEAYRLANLVGNDTANQIFRGDRVWKVQSLPKIKHFL